jgi:phenylacetic acid degradation operon negative regulatory protein
MIPVSSRASAATDAALARWIRRELAVEAPRVPSLIVTIWGDALAPLGNEFWLSTILRLLAPFRVNERAVRTGMFRLHRGGWLQPRAIGRRSRYRLTAAGAEGFERAFHRVYDPPFPPWDGTWEGVIAGAEIGGPAVRKRLREELAWAGYGRFGAGVFLRPARSDGAAARIAQALRLSEGMTAFTARDPPDPALPGLRERAEAVWTLATLGHEYRRFLARFGGVAAASDKRMIDEEQAFVVRTLLVHAYRRVRLRDPQLPREVLADDWPGANAYALARALYRIAAPRAEAFVEAVLGEEAEVALRKPTNPEMRFADTA